MNFFKFLTKHPIKEIQMSPAEVKPVNVEEPKSRKPLVETGFGKFLAGENKAGKIFHIVLDITPLPNVHEVIKAVIKKDKPSNPSDFASAFVNRLDWGRTIGGFMLTAVMVIAYQNGWINKETMGMLIQYGMTIFFGAPLPTGG